eukprot:756013-Hanusia_phi.AAC.6
MTTRTSTLRVLKELRCPVQTEILRRKLRKSTQNGTAINPGRRNRYTLEGMCGRGGDKSGGSCGLMREQTYQNGKIWGWLPTAEADYTGVFSEEPEPLWRMTFDDHQCGTADLDQNELAEAIKNFEEYGESKPEEAKVAVGRKRKGRPPASKVDADSQANGRGGRKTRRQLKPPKEETNEDLDDVPLGERSKMLDLKSSADDNQENEEKGQKTQRKRTRQGDAGKSEEDTEGKAMEVDKGSKSGRPSRVRNSGENEKRKMNEEEEEEEKDIVLQKRIKPHAKGNVIKDIKARASTKSSKESSETSSKDEGTSQGKNEMSSHVKSKKEGTAAGKDHAPEGKEADSERKREKAEGKETSAEREVKSEKKKLEKSMRKEAKDVQRGDEPVKKDKLKEDNLAKKEKFERKEEKSFKTDISHGREGGAAKREAESGRVKQEGDLAKLKPTMKTASGLDALKMQEKKFEKSQSKPDAEKLSKSGTKVTASKKEVQSETSSTQSAQELKAAKPKEVTKSEGVKVEKQPEKKEKTEAPAPAPAPAPAKKPSIPLPLPVLPLPEVKVNDMEKEERGIIDEPEKSRTGQSQTTANTNAPKQDSARLLQQRQNESKFFRTHHLYGYLPIVIEDLHGEELPFSELDQSIEHLFGTLVQRRQLLKEAEEDNEELVMRGGAAGPQE